MFSAMHRFDPIATRSDGEADWMANAGGKKPRRGDPKSAQAGTHRRWVGHVSDSERRATLGNEQHVNRKPRRVALNGGWIDSSIPNVAFVNFH